MELWRFLLFFYRETMGIASFSQIQEFSRVIARQFQPEKIILFGSYAYGEPTSDSDVDLLVVMPFDGRSVHKEIEIRQAIRAPFALDLLVRSSQQIQQRLDMGDFFIRDIVEKGRVIYETDYARVGQ